MKAQATRTIQRGQVTFKVIAKAELVSLERDLDGDKYTDATTLFESILVTISKDGKIVSEGDAVHDLKESVSAHATLIARGAVAVCGEVGMTAETAELVRAAIAEAKADVETPEISEHRAAVKRNRDEQYAADIDADQHRRAIYRAMNP